jgi:coenzyme F420-reducing hydrogenase alpha subunit
MNYNLDLLKQAVERMAAKYKIPVNFFDCKYRKRKGGKIIGIKVIIDAQYLDYDEAWFSLNKWKDRITEFYSMDFIIETYYVNVNHDKKVSITISKKAPEFISDASCVGEVRCG